MRSNRAGFPVSVSVALLVLGTVMGFAARTPAWTAVDAAVSDGVQSLRSPWPTAVAQVLNVGFGTVMGPLLAAALVVGVAVSGRPRAAGRVLVVIAAGWGVSWVLKTVVARSRPPVSDSLVYGLGSGSFPSGHVCLTLSIVIAVATLVRHTRFHRPVLAAGFVLVAVQMLARVYLGAHYATDTLGSIVVAPAAIHVALNARRLGLLDAPWRRRPARPAAAEQAGADAVSPGSDTYSSR
ncbi:phosphatase PAP2 family protein [Nonomuraea sp. NPDC003709]|uniref:phosphatase PAP2 family protein n=1 Tax=Nonomuraea sp. NPDC003709 TaxID=3154450 RepID=UPI0033B18F03